MYYACTNHNSKKIKTIREWRKPSKANLINYVNEEEVSPTVQNLFEDTCFKVLQLITELKILDKLKKIKFSNTPVNVRLLLFMILEMKHRFNGKFTINSKKFAEKVYDAYVSIQEDTSLINQTQVLSRNDIDEVRSINSAFKNYAGKDDNHAFAWCVEELLSRILDYTKDDFGLSDIGVIVKDVRSALTVATKDKVRKEHRVNGKLTSYVTGLPYPDESVLEFAHKTAIGLGKFIFTDSVHSPENIVLVERVLNSTMGQLSVESFKKEYELNKYSYDRLIKAA